MDTNKKDILISNVRAVNSNSEEVVTEIANADIITTAVGLRILKFVAPAIAKGIASRTGRKNLSTSLPAKMVYVPHPNSRNWYSPI